MILLLFFFANHIKKKDDCLIYQSDTQTFINYSRDAPNNPQTFVDSLDILLGTELQINKKKYNIKDGKIEVIETSEVPEVSGGKKLALKKKKKKA